MITAIESAATAGSNSPTICTTTSDATLDGTRRKTTPQITSPLETLKLFFAAAEFTAYQASSELNVTVERNPYQGFLPMRFLISGMQTAEIKLPTTMLLIATTQIIDQPPRHTARQLLFEKGNYPVNEARSKDRADSQVLSSSYYHIKVV
jgi:hypothetical protein